MNQWQDAKEPKKGWYDSMIRRSRKEIFTSILEILEKNPLKKTHIMYQSNLSWNMVNDAIEALSERSLIALEQNSHRYQITEQGLEILELDRRISRKLNLRQATTIE